MDTLDTIIAEMRAYMAGDLRNASAGDPDDLVGDWLAQLSSLRPEAVDTPAAGEVGAMDAIVAAYNTWPADLRAKLSLHDLRRMTGWRPQADAAPVDDYAHRINMALHWLDRCAMGIGELDDVREALEAAAPTREASPDDWADVALCLSNEVLPSMECPDTPDRWLAAMRAALAKQPEAAHGEQGDGRVAFESWARPRWRHREDFDARIGNPAAYNNYEVEAAWQAWQARAALAQPDGVRMVDYFKDREQLCRECGKPTMHIGTLCFACSKRKKAAAPSPEGDKP